MKKFILSAAILATLASCNYNNTIATNYEAIQFGNNFVDNNVRAAVDPSYGTHNPLTSITVYGAVEDVNIFPGVTVEGTVGTTDGQPNVWTQIDGTTQYWIAGAEYIFDAVVGATEVITDTNTGLPTSLTYNTANQTDMLHKRVTTVGKPVDNNGLVAFTFTHLLSKVKLTVQNDTAANATGYRYTISDIKFTNAYTKGDYAVPAGTWSNLTTSTYSIANITVASATSEECKTEVLLIPGAKVGISFKVNTEIKSGDTWKTLNVETKAYEDVVTLAANSAYNFKVTLKLENEIKFTVTEQPEWASDETVNL